ncbi:MAG TPA: VTT domain-containing protein [Nocardioides sp.]
MTDLGIQGLLGLYALVAFGAVVPVVPTGALVSAGAVLAALERPWEIVLVVAVGALGAYTGDLVTYAALRRAGTPLAQRVGWLRADDPHGALRRLREGLERNEVRSLLLSRLIPGGRIPVLLVAALGGYPTARFAAANVAAASLWSVAYAAVGVLGNWLVPDPVVALVVVVAVVLAVGLLPRLLRRGRVHGGAATE